MRAANGVANTNVVFKNCAPFIGCVAHINDEQIDAAKNLDIIMPMYNLIEYNNIVIHLEVYGRLKEMNHL